MNEVPIRVCADVADEAEANAVARELAASLRAKAPGVSLRVGASNPGSMIVGELVTIGLTHLFVMLVIDGIRLAWEMSQKPLKIEAPDGSTYVFHGNNDQLKSFLENLLRGESGGGQGDVKK